MMSINFNWYERIVLWMRIGAMPVPNINAANVFLRILDKLRPSEQEQQDTKLSIEGLNYRWVLPHHQYGDKQIEFENEEAKALADGLDNHPMEVRVSDAAWMLRLLAQLRAPVAVAEENAA